MRPDDEMLYSDGLFDEPVLDHIQSGDKVTLRTIWGEEECVVEQFGTIDGWPGVTVRTNSGDRITVLRSSVHARG